MVSVPATEPGVRAGIWAEVGQARQTQKGWPREGSGFLKADPKDPESEILWEAEGYFLEKVGFQNPFKSEMTNI